VQRGWIRLYRRIQEHELWHKKPFSEGQAWVDILLHTNHDTCTVQFSQRYWAKRWGWSREKVKRFFAYLRDETMVETLESGKIGERPSEVTKQATKVYVQATKGTDQLTIINTNNTLKEQIYIVGNHWNKKGIIHHGPKTIESCETALKKYLLPPFGNGDYWSDDICKAICNYSTVLQEEKYFWTHRWTLKEFLKRGVDRFVEEAQPLTNFLKKTDDAPKGRGRYDFIECPHCKYSANTVKKGHLCPDCGIAIP